MIKEIRLKGKTVPYDLQYKAVKNINLRIKPNGTLFVSANKQVPETAIENFILSKEEFILKVLGQFQDRVNHSQKKYFDENEIRQVVLDLCKQIYPAFEKRGVEFPVIRFRKMKSQWGNCRPKEGILTFNTQLIYVPQECIEYVVAHEFAHFLQPNHSALFYNELALVLPDWKSRRKRLKDVLIVD